MNAQMTTIETVTVVRPIKIISFVCLCFSLFLLLVALFSKNWLQTRAYHTGLLQECTDEGSNYNPVPFGPPPGKCQARSKHTAFTTTVFAVLDVALVATLMAIIFNLLGLKSNDLHKKFAYYKAATCLTIASVLLEVLTLSAFPIVFFYVMTDFGVRQWEFDWSYGLAWGATLFAVAASLLLICDKEHDEIYHKEKTIYNPPPDFA